MRSVRSFKSPRLIGGQSISVINQSLKSPRLIGEQSISDDIQSLKSPQLIGVDVQVRPGRTGVGVAERAG